MQLTSGADSVDADTLGEELVGEDTDHGDLGTLGHRVVEEHGGSGVSDWTSQQETTYAVHSRIYLP